uniref:Uncharacterized protein n=1 Tax=Anguilla anguilla TaxID=7936 RepID=A0A0E9TY67_ANGAN
MKFSQRLCMMPPTLIDLSRLLPDHKKPSTYCLAPGKTLTWC